VLKRNIKSPRASAYRAGLAISVLLLFLQCQRILWKEPPKREPIREWPEVRLIFAGDTHFMWGVEELQKAKGLVYPVEALIPFFAEADFRALNLETTISKRALPMKNKAHVFRSDPEVLATLQALKVDLAILANNHAMDAGEEGLFDTMAALKQAGIGYVGAGRNAREAFQSYHFERKGIRFALLGFNAIGEGLAFSAGARPGVAPAGAEMAALVTRARQEVDHVIVSLHWGVEYYVRPRQDQIERARRLIDAGASIVVGHHPHIPQGMELYGNGLIFYSLGNFLFGSVNQQQEHNIIFRIDFSPENKRPERLVLRAINGRYRERGHRIEFLSMADSRPFWAEFLQQSAELSPVLKERLKLTPQGMEITWEGAVKDRESRGLPVP